MMLYRQVWCKIVEMRDTVHEATVLHSRMQDFTQWRRVLGLCYCA